MLITTEQKNGITVAMVEGGQIIIKDAASAVDLIATIAQQSGCDRMAVPKSAIAEDFFRLSSGRAGEVLQKFINYRAKLAIIGDFSIYTSRPLRDFINESNCGRDIFFVATKDEAMEKLTAQP